MPDHTIGDAPIEEQFYGMMNHLAHELDRLFNGELKGPDRKVGFCLMVFNFGESSGRLNYISNAERNDVMTMLKEQLARWEGQPEMKGTA